MVTNNESLKILKRIFFPAILLSILFAAASSMLLAAENSLLAGKLDFVRLPLLSWPTIWTQVSVGILMLGFSIYCGKSFAKLFRGALLGVMGWIFLFAFLLVYQGTQSRMELLESLYVMLKVFHFDFFSFLIWGFLLRITPAHSAKKYFIPLAVLISLSGEWIRLDLFAKVLQITIPYLLLLSIGFMAAALLVFNVSWKKLSQDPILNIEPEPTKILRFPFLSAALLLVGCSMIKKIFELLWKSEIRSGMSTPESIQKMTHFLSYTGTVTTTLTLCLALLGSWLILKTGWKKTATGVSTFIWIGTIGLFSLRGAPWLTKLLSYALFTSVTKALFFPLVQMLYLQLPSQYRFSVKIGTEMIIFRLFASLHTFATQVLILALGSTATALPWLKKLAIGLALAMMYAARRSGAKYSDSTNASAVQNS